MAQGPGRDLGRVLGFAVAAAVSVSSVSARGDSAPRDDGAIAGSTPTGGPSLVVAADLGGASSTRGAELRAGLYAVARAHGYEPAVKLDVEAAASGESLVVAGTVTDEPLKLEHLRFVLRVGVLVRVSKVTDREGGTVRMTVVTPEGFQTRLLALDTDESIEHALDVLLPRRTDANRTSAASHVDPEEHQLWQARGGFRATYGAMAFASVTSLRHVGFRSPNAAGTGTVTSSATAVGVGGGVGARVGVMYLPTLTPNPDGTFFTARLGFGLDTDFFYLRSPHQFSYSGSSRSVSYDSRALWVASLPIQFGGAVAFGRFSEQSWHGALLGLAYAPEAQYSQDLGRSSGDFRFNPAGAELSVDVTGIDASRGNDSAAQIRIALWGVAPLNDTHPGLLSLGIGAIWY